MPRRTLESWRKNICGLRVLLEETQLRGQSHLYTLFLQLRKYITSFSQQGAPITTRDELRMLSCDERWRFGTRVLDHSPGLAVSTSHSLRKRLHTLDPPSLSSTSYNSRSAINPKSSMTPSQLSPPRLFALTVSPDP